MRSLHPTWRKGIVLLLGMLLSGCAFADTIGTFPVPQGLELRVRFWVNVYTQYGLDQRIFHDRDMPERIYSVIHLRDTYPSGRISSEQADAVIHAEKERIAALLKALGSGTLDRDQWDDETRRLAGLFGPDAKAKDFLDAARRIHVQRGAKENFAEGLVRSGRYVEAMRRLFADRGLPEELVYLAHVESSFNPLACSSAGAQGVWQFTRLGGKRYLDMGQDVDQRRDPLLATAAAAKELARLRSTLGSWPLAVTAYNVGHSGVERAARKSKSTSLAEIIDRYKHRQFGYASKNFYCSFLAAVQVAENVQCYFPGLELETPWTFGTHPVDRARPLPDLALELGVDSSQLAELNPALALAVRRGERPVPAGYGLHVPVEAEREADPLLVAVDRAWTSVQHRFETWIGKHGDAEPLVLDLAADTAAVDTTWPYWSEARYQVAEASATTVVQPGETLGHFAQWLSLPASTLRRLNGMKRRSTVKAGQTLRLDFTRVARADFEAARIAHHQRVWRQFFDDREVESQRQETLGPGGSLWALARRHPQVPFWLLWAANEPEVRQKLRPGHVVSVPVIRASAGPDPLHP